MANDSRDALTKMLHPLPRRWDWEWFTDVMDIDGGTQPPASQFVSKLKPGYVRLVQIRDFESKNHLTYIPDSPKWRKCSTKDVLIARYGAALGRICKGLEGAYNVALAKVVPSKRVDIGFAYYLLQSNYFQGRLLASGDRSAQAGFNKRDLAVIALPLPPPKEQHAIAHILGTLDDKIELNRRMSETLEAMARAMFKSWFVDFDPVRRNIARRRGQPSPRPVGHPSPSGRGDGGEGVIESTAFDHLFPDRLVDSELGEIPEGWHIDTLDEVITQYKESVTPSEFADRVFVHFSLPAFDEGRMPHVESGETIKSNKWRVARDSVLLSKLNPEIDRTWLVDVEDNQLTICSTEFLVLLATKPFTRAYVYCLARSLPFRQQLESMVTGTSKSHQRVQPTALMELSVLIPNAHTLAAFDTAVSALLAQVLIMRRESLTLATLRDTLLPKLISGELRVTNAESATEAIV